VAQLLRGKKFQFAVDVEVSIEEFFAYKVTRHSRNWLKNGWRPLNMRVCILNTELLLFCMFCPISFNFESNIIYGTPSVKMSN
jgi:hypothetical protein